ncbi:4Fe-4S binding protein [Bacteroidota bacterium]
MFVLLGIVLITSLFIKRPWCDFLCPVNPVFVYIRKLRNLILEPWRKK